ncbi:MAG: hypothetical protein M3143_13430 [Actinomycetota bacterium]|nr:hypothetical protein [Actinomycetota bacterium]
MRGCRRGGGVHLRVTIPYTALLGCDDQPGEIAGYRPIPAAVARDLAAAGTWRRILTDPTSNRPWTTAPPATAHQNTSSPDSSSPETTPANSPAAGYPRTAATSVGALNVWTRTPSRGPRVSYAALAGQGR